MIDVNARTAILKVIIAIEALTVELKSHDSVLQVDRSRALLREAEKLIASLKAAA